MLFGILVNNAVTIVVFCVLFVLTWIFVRAKRPHGIPPGPTPLPVIGNIIDLRGDLRQVYRKLRGKYGDIFSVYIGNNLTVVINGYEAVREVFVKNADVFSDRPDTVAPTEARFRGTKGIIMACGELWKKNRRFALSTLRDFGMGKNLLQAKIQEEVTVLIKAIEKQNGDAFDMKDIIQKAVSNIICSIVFGKRFDYDDLEFQRNMMVISEIFSVGGLERLARVFPFLNKVPGISTKKEHRRKLFFEVAEFTSGIIFQHLKSFDGNNIRSVIDAYIKQEKLDEKDLSLEDIKGTELPRIVTDLFLGGTETTATALMWAFLYFLHYPEMQEKVSEQVQNATRPESLPGMEDKVKMPLLEATIMEVLRHADILPLSVPHAAQEDVRVRGFFIPKGTVVFLNIDSVLTDDKLWSKPEEFNPDRFLDSESLKKFEYFIPFSLGKRVCLGESLARMELTIFLSALTKHFKFVTPVGEGPPPMEGNLGTTFASKRYMIRAIKRTQNC